MLDIIEKYNAQRREQEAQVKELDAQVAAKLDKAERLTKQAEKLKEKRNKLFFSSNWITGILEPLGEELARRTGLSYEIYGPFGLRCQASIYLRADMSSSITEQTTRSISLVPWTDPETGAESVRYETGETTGAYGKGTLGELNGMNNVTAPLPDTIEEIEKLLRTTGSIQEAQQK